MFDFFKRCDRCAEQILLLCDLERFDQALLLGPLGQLCRIGDYQENVLELLGSEQLARLPSVQQWGQQGQIPIPTGRPAERGGATVLTSTGKHAPNCIEFVD